MLQWNYCQLSPTFQKLNFEYLSREFQITVTQTFTLSPFFPVTHFPVPSFLVPFKIVPSQFLSSALSHPLSPSHLHCIHFPVTHCHIEIATCHCTGFLEPAFLVPFQIVLFQFLSSVFQMKLHCYLSPKHKLLLSSVTQRFTLPPCHMSHTVTQTVPSSFPDRSKFPVRSIQIV